VIEALFLDFDGTLWDSEDASFRSWQETYAEFGLTLSLEDFAPVIGTLGGVDLLSELERRARRPVDRHRVGERRRQRKLELLQSAGPRPGVLDYLRDARELGLAVAIVSTDEANWITQGLSILGLLEAWDFIECADGDVSRAKPSPALYLSALERLGIAHPRRSPSRTQEMGSGRRSERSSSRSRCRTRSLDSWIRAKPTAS
jgi:beta-phosphoglucomutase-like phosphatase (HAD superfamily)